MSGRFYPSIGFSLMLPHVVKKVADDGFDPGTPPGEAKFWQQFVNDLVVRAQVAVGVDPLGELDDLEAVVFGDRVADGDVGTRAATRSRGRRLRTCYRAVLVFG